MSHKNSASWGQSCLTLQSLPDSDTIFSQENYMALQEQEEKGDLWSKLFFVWFLLGRSI